MASGPDRRDYSDAAFNTFASASTIKGGESRDADGNRVYSRPKPLTWVAVYALALLGALAVGTPVPAVVAALLAWRAHRHGERFMRFAFVFSLACVAIGVWMMLTYRPGGTL
jgi:hypothetical protein